MRRILLFFALPGVMVATQSSAISAQSERVQLAGTWVLNRELSDDLEEFQREADTGVPKALASGRVRVAVVRPRSPADRPDAFGWPRGFDPQVLKDAIATLSQPPERVSIIVNADTVSLVHADSTPYAIVVDGKKSQRAWRDSLPAEIKATWKDEALRVERKLYNELKITEIYAIDPKSQKLVVVTTAEDAIPSKLEVKYVYDRSSGS